MQMIPYRMFDSHSFGSLQTKVVFDIKNKW